MMNINDFKKLAMVNKTTVKEDVVLSIFVDGEKKEIATTFYVSEASHADMADAVQEARSSGKEPRAEYLYISTYIRDKDGNRVFTYEEAANLKPEIVNTLYPLTIKQFAGMRDPKKASRQKKTSGAS